MRETVISSGQLRHKAQIQRPIETANSFGEREVVWETINEVYVGIEPLNAKELFAAQQVQADVSHKITTRFTKELKPKYRLVYHDYELKADRVFNIDGKINPRELNRKLIVMAKEEV